MLFCCVLSFLSYLVLSVLICFVLCCLSLVDVGSSSRVLFFVVLFSSVLSCLVLCSVVFATENTKCICNCGGWAA